MTRVEAIIEEIKKLSPEEVAELRQWLEELSQDRLEDSSNEKDAR